MGYTLGYTAMSFYTLTTFLALGIACILTSSAYGAITLSNGSVSPPYPANSPDPWNILGTLAISGTLDVDSSSQIDAGSLQFSTVDAALFIDNASVALGNLAPLTETIFYINLANAATLTTAGSGGPGARSTTVISLDSGSAFTATGDQNFGGVSSSFTLGPASDSANVTIAKAVANDFVIGALGGGSPLGQNTTFKVAGSASIGGAGSDALIALNSNSTFDVTGDLNGLGAGSVFTNVSVNSSYKVGGSATWIDGDRSSATGFFRNGTVEIGGDWTILNGHGSNATITSIGTDHTIGGSLLFLLTGNSAIEHIFTGGLVEIGSDFITGSPSTTQAAISTVATNTTITTTNGDYIAEVGTDSVISAEASVTTFNIGGDYISRASSGRRSTNVHDFDACVFNIDGSLILQRDDVQRGSTVIKLTNTALDISDDFRISATGEGSDTSVLFQDVSGTIDRDFIIETTATRLIQNCSEIGNQGGGACTIVLATVDLAIGRDAIFSRPGLPAAQQQFAAFALDLEIGGDLTFGENQFFTITSSDFIVVGSTTLAGELNSAEVMIDGDLNVTSTGAIAPRYPTVGAPPAFGIKSTGDISFSEGATITVPLSTASQAGAYEFIIDGGTTPLSLNGNLVIHFMGDYQNDVTSADSFTIIRSPQPTIGAFDNIASGSRLDTADGRGSFLVTYGAGSTTVTISAFQPSPPPAAPRITAIIPEADSFRLEWQPFGSTGNYAIEASNTGAFGTWTRLHQTSQTHTNVPRPEGCNRLLFRVIQVN